VLVAQAQIVNMFFLFQVAVFAFVGGDTGERGPIDYPPSVLDVFGLMQMLEQWACSMVL
jgi:hypothetical protein